MSIGIQQLCESVLHLNNIIAEDIICYEDSLGQHRINLMLAPTRESDNLCPICGKKCVGYDTHGHFGDGERKHWRSLDWGQALVTISYATHRIFCPDHGVITSAVPWAYHNSSFTKEFDKTVTWKAQQCSKSAITKEMRISWKTVGNCISRVRNDVEPDLKDRYSDLKRIGIDETSIATGHSYLTVVVNHDNNEVVWVSYGHSEEVLSQFFEELSEDQREKIELVTGDGAKWIKNCVNKYLKNAIFCIDSFHVVEWINGALSELRLEEWREKLAELKSLKKKREQARLKAKVNKDEKYKKLAESLDLQVSAKQEEVKKIKGGLYALGKNPENLTESQKLKLAWLIQSSSKLHRAYDRKEQLRNALHCADFNVAREEIKKWIRWTKVCRIELFKKLGQKIERHLDSIINTIKYKMNNARIEATNNVIKLIIKRGFGYRNIQNLMDLVLVTCTKKYKTLPNRYNSSGFSGNWRSLKVA
ncbi:MAG: ISL3 family transposase [Treponema sp.]|nr:ISL3 family transposase [Treponema sp.]